MSSSTMKNVCEVCGGICNAKNSVCCSTCNNISSHICCLDTPSLIPKSWKCEDCAKKTAIYEKKRRSTQLIDCETARNALNSSRSLVIKTSHITNTGSLKGNAPSSSTDREKAHHTSVDNSRRTLEKSEIRIHEKNIAKSVVARYPTVKIDPRTGNSKKSGCDSNVIPSRRPNELNSLHKATTSHDPMRVGSIGNDCADSRLKDDQCENTNPPQKLLIITEGTLPHQPVPCANWKGDFQITDMCTDQWRDIHDIQAHIPGAVCHKVYVTIKNLVGKDIELKLLPRFKVWPKIFLLDPPQLNDVGLYFFPSKDERLRRAFTRCVDMMDQKDLAMMGSVSSDAKLLIFSSVQLPQDPYAIGIATEICMWGVLKYSKYKTNCIIRP